MIICKTSMKTLPESCTWCYMMRPDGALTNGTYKIPAKCFGCNRRLTDEDMITALTSRVEWCPLKEVEEKE